MKRNMSIASYLLLGFIAIFFAACGGGSPDGGTKHTDPTLVSQAATGVSDVQATLNARVNTGGDNCDLYWVVATDNNYINIVRTLQAMTVNSSSETNFPMTANGLTQGTNYWAKPFLSGSHGTLSGQGISFRTAIYGSAPFVQTNGSSDVTTTGGKVYMSVTPNGQSTRGRVRHGTDPSLTVYTPTAWINAGAGMVSVDLDFTLTGYAANTRAYYQAEADSILGNPLGAIQSFVTNPLITPPTATTVGASNVTVNGFRVEGSVNPGNALTKSWVDYTTDPAHGSWWSTAKTAVGSDSADHQVFTDLTGLLDNTAYEYRQAAGRDGEPPVYGNWLSARTAANVATVNKWVGSLASAIIIRNNVEVARLSNPTGPPMIMTYVGTPGKYKAIDDLTVYGQGFYVAVDQNGNNEWDISAGGQLNLNSVTGQTYPGSLDYIVTGSDFTARRTLADVNATWPDNTVVTRSNNPNAPVGLVTYETLVFAQNQFDVSADFGSPMGVRHGVINGDYLYFYVAYNDAGWYVTFELKTIVAPDNNSMSGTQRMTWSPGGYYTEGTFDATRSPQLLAPARAAARATTVVPTKKSTWVAPR